MSIIVYSDGSNKSDGSNTKSAVVIDGVIELVKVLDRAGWSDVAEYGAIQLGLEWLLLNGFDKESIKWFNDSAFVMKQMSGQWPIRRHKNYTDLAVACRELAKYFTDITFTWIPRRYNRADCLSKF